jgi:hypothetical protein
MLPPRCPRPSLRSTLCQLAAPSCARSRAAARGGAGLGLAAPAWRALLAGEPQPRPRPHIAPRAKRAVWLIMSGGPSQFETFDYQPLLQRRRGEELPDSVRQGQRLTGMSGNQSTLPVVG